MATETSARHSLDRQLPQALETERAVLGAMLIDKMAIGKAIEHLDETYFYKDAHRKIFQALTALFERNEAADQITVAEELRRRKQLDEVGGPLYIAQLAGDVSTSANVEYHAKIVLEKALLRRLITLSTQVVAEAYEDTEDVFEVVDRAEQKIFSISEKRLGRGFRPLKSVLHDAFEEIDRAHKQHGDIVGVPSGFEKLDELTTGFQPSDLIIIASRPSMGKTAMALNMARNAAADGGTPVAFFSLEMSNRQIAQRLLCAESHIDQHRLRRGKLTTEEWNRLASWVGKLAEAPIYVDDTPGMTVLEMRAKARRLKAEHGLGLVVVDYLQLIQATRTAENRQQEISYISRSLKELAKELDVPVIALSQLSRAVEMRGGDHRPQLSDLRESGAIEQDADLVMFIYRAARYGIMEDKDGESLEGIAEVIIGKQRNGPVGTVRLAWTDQYARFDDLSLDRQEPPF